MGKPEVDAAYKRYGKVMGADPVREAEPSVEQLTVLINKVVTRGATPYADFSVLMPYSRRAAKNLKAKGFLLQDDGTWKQTEVAGPPSFESWQASFDVYRTILLMLEHNPVVPGGDKRPVMTWAAMDEYFRTIQNLNRQWPECWHLLVQAEDRCRADHLERTRRVLTRAVAEARLPMNLEFSVDQPWIGVFTHVARDITYWTQEMQIPAQNYITRGGKWMSRKDAESAETGETSKNKNRPPGEGESKAAKKRKRDREKRDWMYVTGSTETSSWRGPGGTGGGKSEGKGKMNPCKDSRVHACQLCLGAHPNSSCQKGKDKGGGSKGK